MKRIFLLLMIAAMSVLSCKSSQVEPNDINKAKEIYKKYASRNDLTVALIGEYKGYNAVMLKAHTDEEWEFICKEFDIKPEKEINQEFINKRTVVSKSDTSSKNMEDVENFIENIGINIDSLISELHIDTLINDKEIKNVIAVGEVAASIKKLVPELATGDRINKEKFEELYKLIIGHHPQEISENYGIPYERATLMLPNIIIYQSFLNNCKAEEIYFPNVDFNDGITANYMDEGSRVVFEHNFEEDVIASAHNIARRYRCNKSHIERIADYALKIFDAVKKPYGMGKIERLQLQISSLLHDCGNFINMNDAAKNSYYIIANTEIIGFSHKERMEVANIVKYNTHYLPGKNKVSAELDGCDYMNIAKLTAILRIANVLDKSHTQKIEDLSVSVKDNQLVITANTYEDIALEAGLFESRADFFEKIYGIRPILRQRRTV